VAYTSWHSAATPVAPAFAQQRCTVRALRTVTAGMPERHKRELKTPRGRSSTMPDPVPARRSSRGLQATVPDYGPRNRRGDPRYCNAEPSRRQALDEDDI
jgi:hypothetical protein